MAMRTPVKLPGPIVAAIRSSEAKAVPLSCITSATIGISASAWPRAIKASRKTSVRAAPSTASSAAEQAPMLVSSARMFIAVS